MKHILLAVFTLFLLACSADRPSEAEIERAVMSSQSVPGILTVVEVKKLDGWMEGDLYVADVIYTLEFQVNSSDLNSDLQIDSAGGILQALVGGLGVMALRMAYGDFQKGDRVDVPNEFRFFPTERGWRLKQ